MTDTVKELGEAPDLTVDEFLRICVSQMFENDNDTSYLTAKLSATDGTESTLEFKVKLEAINGIKTRDEDDA
jgi:hypothetical protein